MDDHVIDCCSLINLYTGWRGLEELFALKKTWHVCEAILRETEYTREYAQEGFTTVPIDLDPLLKRGVLVATQPETAAEIDDYVNLAMELDDGEAQAIAIAKNRGYVLLTDDYKAAKLASSADVGVAVISTPMLLEQWGELNAGNKARLHEIVRRISRLARFTPRADSTYYDWWRACLQE